MEIFAITIERRVMKGGKEGDRLSETRKK